MDTNKLTDYLKRIGEEITRVIPDWGNYAFFQIDGGLTSIIYNIADDCPAEMREAIEKAILSQASSLGLSAGSDEIE